MAAPTGHPPLNPRAVPRLCRSARPCVPLSPLPSFAASPARVAAARRLAAVRRRPPLLVPMMLERTTGFELLFDAIEREQLCDLLDQLGPQAPTLLDPWTTHDLAAHLVLREHDFLAAPGLVVPGGWGRIAERRRLALKETGFTDLVATIRSGPPPGFFRIGWVRRVPNLPRGHALALAGNSPRRCARIIFVN